MGLDSIGSVENIPQFVQDVKDRKKKLMGFGHRVYKNYDPRARIVRTLADKVFGILGRGPEGSLFHRAQAVSKCGFLLWFDLQDYGIPNRHVPSAIHDPSLLRLVGTQGRAAG